MIAAEFRMLSEWHLPVAPERVWPVLSRVEGWPGWWPQVDSVVGIAPGDAHGRGARHRVLWSSGLVHALDLTLTTCEVEAPRLIRGLAGGDLIGEGCWRLAAIPIGTRVRYAWNVRPTRAWMRATSRLLARLFAWNHHRVMRAGAAGMARALGVELIDYRALA